MGNVENMPNVSLMGRIRNSIFHICDVLWRYVLCGRIDRTYLSCPHLSDRFCPAQSTSESFLLNGPNVLTLKSTQMLSADTRQRLVENLVIRLLMHDVLCNSLLVADDRQEDQCRSI